MEWQEVLHKETLYNRFVQSHALFFFFIRWNFIFNKAGLNETKAHNYKWSTLIQYCNHLHTSLTTFLLIVPFLAWDVQSRTACSSTISRTGPVGPALSFAAHHSHVCGTSTKDAEGAPL